VVIKLEDDDIRAAVFWMGREVAISRCTQILVITTMNLHDLERTALLAPSTAWESQLMNDALTAA
jgi:hypothetical protein